MHSVQMAKNIEKVQVEYFEYCMTQVWTKYCFVKANYVYNNYTSNYPSIILTIYPSFHILMQ